MFERVKDLQCGKCGCTSIVFRKKYYCKGTRYHVGVYCSQCGAWIKWVPKCFIEEDSNV